MKQNLISTEQEQKILGEIMKSKQNGAIITTQVLNLSAFLSHEHNLTKVQNGNFTSCRILR
jgi:hypothetical protein